MKPDIEELLLQLAVLDQPVLPITRIDHLVRSKHKPPPFYPLIWLSRVWWGANN